MAKKRVERKAGSRRRSPPRGPILIKHTLEKAFRKEFPKDTVDISDGYKGNVHVLVVSRRFDGLPESDKHDLLWGIVRNSGLTLQETNRVSLLLGLSPAEIK